VTGWELLTSTWDWEPSVVVGSALLLAAYLAAVRFRLDVHTASFASGVGVLLLALVSPLDELGDDYLFSAHMLQHILLDLVAPLLLVLGLPASLVAGILAWRPVAVVEKVLGAPPVAWFLGIGTLWTWHLPSLYDWTLRSEPVHVFEHLTFLVTGTILYWPVLGRTRARAMAPLVSIGYLCAAAVANGVLGVIFTLASTPFYQGYAHPADRLGALPLIRGVWGLDQVADQRLGGVFMWAIGSVIFLSAIMVVFVRWYREPEDDLRAPGAGKEGSAA
jgi:cytochrome c oxidase assembly factor CtaG